MTDSQSRTGKIIIQINSADLAADVLANLDEAIIEDDLGQPAMFTLRFNDREFRLVDGDTFKLGAEIKIGAPSKAGSQAVVLLTGEVTALEPVFEQHSLVLIVRGYDRSHRLHRGNRTRTFLKQSDGDIVGQIARDLGLRTEIKAKGERHEYVIQDNQTDMQFLRARAARIGCQVAVEGQTLKFRPAEAAPPVAPAQEWGSSLLAFRARLTAVAQSNEVQVRGWDPKAKRAIVGKASRPAQPWKIGEKANGATLAEQAFGKPATLIVSDELVRSEGEAQKLAQAMLDELGEDLLSVEGTCIGEAMIRAGAHVELKGIGKRFSGTYFISASRHVYTSSEGYMTTFYVNGRRTGGLLAAIEDRPTRPAVSGVVVGIVTNNSDPDKLGRVKLRFPWLDDNNESDWARVIGIGAGNERGLLVVPEVNDEVLVAFEQGDMNRAYVIGGLWNGKDKPPQGDAVQGGKVQARVLKTRAGHSITISDKDAKGQIELKTAKHTVTLDDSGMGKATIKTSKHTLTLDDGGLGNVLIDSGGNVEIKGPGGKLSIGATGVELSSTATLTIKGTLVQIN